MTRTIPLSRPEMERLSNKWAALFQIPSSWIRNIAYVETNWRPWLSNPRGNAWGLMQIKPTTAADILRRYSKSEIIKSPIAKEVLKKWDGTGESLLDPDLNTFFGAAYLRLISKRFGNLLDVLAAAYNQGEGAVRNALAKAASSGRPFQTFLKPEGRKYIAMTFAARDRGFA